MLATTGAGGSAGEDLLEMPPGEAVLALEEEGAGDLEVDAHQVRAADEDGVEVGDGLVEEGFAGLGLGGSLGGGDGLHASTEQRTYLEFTLRRLIKGQVWKFSGVHHHRRKAEQKRGGSDGPDRHDIRAEQWKGQQKRQCPDLDRMRPGRHRMYQQKLKIERRPVVVKRKAGRRSGSLRGD